MKKKILALLILSAACAKAQNSPYYPNGDELLSKELSAVLQKNTMPNTSPLMYQYTVSFDVRTDSTIANINIINGVNSELDNQFKKALTRLRFIPALHNGAPMKMNIMKTITVKF
jgi:hypothetical protein